MQNDPYDPEVKMPRSVTQNRLLNLDPAEVGKIEVRLTAQHGDVGEVDLRQLIEQKSDELIDRAIEWLMSLPWLGVVLKAPVVGKWIRGKIRDRIDDYIPDGAEADLQRIAAQLLARL